MNRRNSRALAHPSPLPLIQINEDHCSVRQVDREAGAFVESCTLLRAVRLGVLVGLIFVLVFLGLIVLGGGPFALRRLLAAGSSSSSEASSELPRAAEAPFAPAAGEWRCGRTACSLC